MQGSEKIQGTRPCADKRSGFFRWRGRSPFFNGLLTVIKVAATHGLQGLDQVAPDFPAIPDALDMPARQRLIGVVVVGRDIHARGLLDDSGTGETDIGRTHRELVRRASQEAGHRPGVGVGVVKDQIQAARFRVAAHGHGAARHLDDAVDAFLNADARSAVHIGQERQLLLARPFHGADELLALGRAHAAAAERAHEHGDHDGGALDARLEGHAPALVAGLAFCLVELEVEPVELERVGGLDLGEELVDGTRIKDVVQVPLVFHGEMVSAEAAHPGPLPEQVRGPLVEAAVHGRVGADHGPVRLGLGADVLPLAAVLRPVVPGRERGQPGLVHVFLVLAQEQLGHDVFPVPRRTADHDLHLGVHVFGQFRDLLVLFAEQVVAKIGIQGGKELSGPFAAATEPVPLVNIRVLGHAAKLHVPGPEQTILGPAVEAPAHIHVRPLVSPQGERTEKAHAPNVEDNLIGGRNHGFAQLAEEVVMFGPGTKLRFVYLPVHKAHGAVVVGRHLELPGAVLDEFGLGALPAAQAAFDGGRALGRDDRVVAVRHHDARVGKADGLGPAGPTFGDDGHDGHLESGHLVEILGDLLGRARIVLDGIGTGGEDVGVDRNVLRLRNLHVVQGLGVAPGLDRTAVAELLPVPLFLADDHDRLIVDLLALTTGNVGAGDEHARVDAVIVLTADLGVVVVHVFEDVFQADALRVPHDAHLVHGCQVAFELLLQKTEQLFQGFQLPDGFLLGQARLAGDVFAELGLQHDHIRILIGAENIQDVFQAIPQFLYAFFNIHKSFAIASQAWVIRLAQNDDLLRHCGKPRPSRMHEYASAPDFLVSRISPFLNSLNVGNYSLSYRVFRRRLSA